MALPYFYTKELSENRTTLVLDEDTSKHIIQVLRMKKEEQVLLTDGKGKKATALIVDDHRKKAVVRIANIELEAETRPTVSIAISLLKNASRFEWFLEKATEIGVNEIIPLMCERTEKEKFRLDRMQNILISAMLQSQQCRMPFLQEPIGFDRLIKATAYHQKFIAHCLPEKKQQLAALIHGAPSTIHDKALILIGPEGDFTPEEIEQALAQNYIPVALGNTRLRTETAGMVAATLLCAARDSVPAD